MNSSFSIICGGWAAGGTSAGGGTGATLAVVGTEGGGIVFGAETLERNSFCRYKELGSKALA